MSQVGKGDSGTIPCSIRPNKFVGTQSYMAELELKPCLPGLSSLGYAHLCTPCAECVPSMGTFRTFPVYTFSLGWLSTGACSSPQTFEPLALLGSGWPRGTGEKIKSVISRRGPTRDEVVQTAPTAQGYILTPETEV